jgi:type IV fimbrial biogenesis protein FimT
MFKNRNDLSRQGKSSLARAGGFSLIELIITVGIASILLMVGIPQFTNIIQQQNTNGEANNLYNDLIFARSEAIKEGQYVSICVTNATYTGCNTTGSWANGWIVYSNPGTNAAGGFVAGTSVLLKKQVAFTSTDTVAASPAATEITFNRDGFGMSLSATTGQLLTIHSATTNTAATKCVWLNLLGMPVIQKSGTTAVTGQGTNTCT